MERFSFKEDAYDPVEYSEKIAEQKIAALHEVPMIHHALDTNGMTPLFELIAKQIIGVLGLV